MLVLSRSIGGKILIGDDICLTIVDVQRGKVRIGIEAPRDVSIVREELLPVSNKPSTVIENSRRIEGKP